MERVTSLRAVALKGTDYVLHMYLLLLDPPHLRPNAHLNIRINLFPLIDQLREIESLLSVVIDPINNSRSLRRPFLANTNRQVDAIMPFAIV